MDQRGCEGPPARLRSGVARGAARFWATLKAQARALRQGLPLVVWVPALLASGGLSPTALATVAEVELPFSAVVPASAFPLEVTAEVARWKTRFRATEGEAFQRLLGRQEVYAELILSHLRERGMPEDLQYLAMMESGLSNRAVSHASAAGLWQLMEGTALELGLRVDEWVDERRDPVRSTAAALDYLARLYERYGSWYLAIAAYNAGPGKVDGVVRRHAGGRWGDEAVYWEVRRHLPRETQDYVPRLVAATLVAVDPSWPSVTLPETEPYRYERVFVPGGTSVSRVAWILGVESRALHALNRHLLQGVTPPGESYPLRVPPGLSDEVVALLGGRLRS